MSHFSTGGRRGIAAASLLGLLAMTVACGSQQDQALDPGGTVRDGTSASQEGQSQRALDADALRAAQGQLPDESKRPAGKRVPDAMP